MMHQSFATRSFVWASLLTRQTSKAFQISSKLGFSNTKVQSSNLITEQDLEFLNLAVDYAKNGLGHTFPNPAVGCVLVNQDSNQVIGSGFHPQAGLPHAEVFALFEASNNLPQGCTGVDAALSIAKQPDKLKADHVLGLTKAYLSQNGPQNLFENIFENTPVTAYVTLEPCCHRGKRTPPCAYSLSMAKVDRVVVGYRDPNPHVDGAGVEVLRQAGIEVQLAESRECETLVQNFFRRVTLDFDETTITGSMRRALRTMAERKKADQSLLQMEWPRDKHRGKVDQEKEEDGIMQLELIPSWMEHLDTQLWQQELVLLRLNNVVAKKKTAKVLGQRIAAELNAHVAQVLGHTALLYRPSIPASLDLEALVQRGHANDSTQTKPIE